MATLSLLDVLLDNLGPPRLWRDPLALPSSLANIRGDGPTEGTIMTVALLPEGWSEEMSHPRHLEPVPARNVNADGLGDARTSNKPNVDPVLLTRAVEM